MRNARAKGSFTTHAEAALEEGRHWRRLSAEERVSAVEVIRRATPGIGDRVPARMERVHRITVLQAHWFLVVGAHALAAIGRPRATQDLDLLVEPTETNASRLGEALAAFGYSAPALQWRRFTEPDRMATLGVAPMRIPILTEISGVTFAAAWKGRRRLAHGARRIAFLGEAEFLRNK